ncbi:MAG: hypothetical protein ACE5JS_20690 [Nitrospinota bacterium]
MKVSVRMLLLVGSLLSCVVILDAGAQDSIPGFGIPQLVRLDPKGVVPVEISVKPGTTVIWLNSTRGFVTVVFAGGEEVAAATQSPTRFFLAPDGTFTTNAFAPGAVASLAFLSPGQYRYFVSGVPGDFVSGEGVFGKILVKEKVKEKGPP